ncbi:MAG: phosphotransferase enzyme family protein [Streptosporangiaceae bacterium]
MHERPTDLTDAEVADALRVHWSLAPVRLDYLPHGFGGYHWAATGRDGDRWFVTANRTDADADRADLVTAMAATAGLFDRGLDFVVAPVRCGSGETASPVGPRYALTVFPFADGTPGLWGDAMTAADRAMVARMLASLHQAQQGLDAVPVRTAELPGRVRRGFSSECGRPWRGGPYAAVAWELLSEQAASLQAGLAAFDDLAAQVAAEGRPAVITHGEPHPGNLIRSGGRYLLVDWDTMGLAAPERDLWWVLSETGTEASLYATLTGREVSQAAVALYRLRWDLEDIGLLLADLRAANQANDDTETGWAGLRSAVLRIAGNCARSSPD